MKFSFIADISRVVLPTSGFRGCILLRVDFEGLNIFGREADVG